MKWLLKMPLPDKLSPPRIIKGLYYLTDVVRLLVLAAVYFGAARFGLSMVVTMGQQASFVWPPAGIALAAVLLFGYRVWPAIMLAAFLAEASAPEPVLTALAIAIGNTLEALVGVWLMRWFAGDGDYLERLRGILGLLFLAASISTVIGATVGATSVCFSGLQPWTAYSSIWLTWWTGDAAGVLIVAPLLLAWGRGPYSLPPLPVIAEAMILLSVSVAAGAIIFIHPAKMGSVWVYPNVFFPVVTWVALRLGQRAVTVMIMAISGITLWIAVQHIGIFSPLGPLPNLPFAKALVTVQLSTASFAIIGLTVCAAMSERREAERQSLKSLRYLQNVIDNIPDPVLIKNRQHVLTSGNKALWEILNGSPEKLIGHVCDDYFPRREEAAAFNEKYDRVFDTGETSVSEEIFTDYTGKRHILSFKIAALTDDKQEPSIVAVARDITALKETEDLLLRYTRDLERRNSELDDFAHVAAHDLKEPLRSMNIDAALLLEDHPDELEAEIVKRLERIMFMSRRMNKLVTDLLRFSRLGRIAPVVEKVDPGAIIADIRSMMESLLHEKNAAIIMPEPLPAIICDRMGLEEILRSLIINAIKYNDKASKTVAVGMLESAVSPRGPEHNVFYVRDNGLGIDPQYHQIIFRIFKRLPDSAKYDETGTGMGLTFVKKIIERNNGCIWLSSEPGKGSTFYFTLGK